MARKYRVFEYATPSFGKGYVYAGSEKSALAKLRKRKVQLHSSIGLSDYDRLSKKSKRARLLQVN